MQEVLALGSIGGAVVIIPETTEPGEQVVFSRDLDPQFLPCRETFQACPGVKCGTQDDYVQAGIFRQPCPVLEQPLVSGQCSLNGGQCMFNDSLNVSCVSWRPSCSSQYSCTTEEEYEARDTSSCFRIPPPTPNHVCVPQDGGCERYNPCRTWQSHCRGEYVCGSHEQYARFRHGPTPICVFDPNPIIHQPPGECLYRDGECQWSECRAWLGHCQQSWRCGSQYDFLVFQSEDLPVCANPGPDFRPPPVPGVCKFNLTTGQCGFRPECEGGMEYTDCGSRCPRTCKTEFGNSEPLFCPTVCVRGCFCPNHLVLHNGSCIEPSQCPNASPCKPNPCGEDQECEVFPVPCERAPCGPPVAVCKNKLVLEVDVDNAVLVVSARYNGARLVRVIIRDSENNRYTRSVRGSSLMEKFSNLPAGRTSVRALARSAGGDKITSEWTVINI